MIYHGVKKSRQLCWMPAIASVLWGWRFTITCVLSHGSQQLSCSRRSIVVKVIGVNCKYSEICCATSYSMLKLNHILTGPCIRFVKHLISARAAHTNKFLSKVAVGLQKRQPLHPTQKTTATGVTAHSAAGDLKAYTSIC